MKKKCQPHFFVFKVCRPTVFSGNAQAVMCIHSSINDVYGVKEKACGPLYFVLFISFLNCLHF